MAEKPSGSGNEIEDIQLERDVVIEVQGLSKRFGERTIFHDISLQVRRGTIVALMGPSGAGKSTLVRCINLLEVPSGGSIRVEGQLTYSDGIKVSKKELVGIRRELGMVFQQFNIFSHLTAIENVALARIVGLHEKADLAMKIAKEMLNQVGLGERAFALPRQLSGGEQQRVGIARALALKPAALLFDEPTSSLDPEMRGEVLDVMRKLANDGMTMVVVTHEVGFALEVSDWIVLLDSGVIAEEGPPAKMLHDPTHERTRQFMSKAGSTPAPREFPSSSSS